MKSSGGGGGEDNKSPDKEPKKKERSGGSIKKRLSIGYGFSSLRKRNPIKGVFEEEDRKKGKSIEIKVGDVGWKQTKHVGQEEAQQLKALMVLTKQLGEEDTDEIAQLLQEWDADKVQKEIEDKRRMQMQKNRSLQVVMEQWGRSGPERDAFSLPSDADGALSLSSPSAITLPAAPAPAPAPATPIPPTPGDSAADTLTSTSTIATLTSSAASLTCSAGAPNNNPDATADQDQLKKAHASTSMMTMTSAGDNKSHHHHNDDYDGRRRGSSFDDSSPTWSVDDEYTADSSVIIDDDDEDLMEVPEIGSEGNESEGSEGGGGRSPRASSPVKKKKIREPRPPSMVFGKKENLDLRDWQTFLEAERARALPYVVSSPRRAASPRNSPRNSPAGFLIFKQKKMLTTLNSNPSSSPSSKLGSGGRHPTRPRSGSDDVSSDANGAGGGDDVSSDVSRASMSRQKGAGRAWSDDESSSYEHQRRSGDGSGRGDIGDEVVELAEMSEGEGEETEGEKFSHRRDSTSSARVSPATPPPTSTPTTPKAGSPTIPKIVLTPQMQERTVKLPPPAAAQSPTSPPRGAAAGADVSSASGSGATSAAASTSPGRTSRRKAAGEQIRRISLSDSQLVFFQRWMRDKVKDGKHLEVPADVEQEIRERERDAVRRYDKMEADGLRKALVKRDKELAVLRRAVEELKGREEKAAARERELRDEVRRERERADRVQARENVLKEMIREKVEEKRKMKEERERELELRRVSSSDDQQQHQHQHQPQQRRATKENKKEKKEKEKEKGKSEKKRRGSAIKFVSKEKGERERERSSRTGGRLDSSGERAPEPIQHSSGLGSAASDEVTSLQELVKGAGTWSKSRGREVKIFKHLRSKSSEEVPTAYVAKESRETH